jgi:hypothetical protein
VIGSGSHVLTKPISARSYSARINGTTATINVTSVADTIYLSPFIPANTLTVSNFQINVTSLTLLANARILIYSDSNGVPTTKLLESTSLDCSTTGTKTYTASFTFTAGTTYWLGIYSNLAVIMSALNSSQLIPISTSAFTGTFGTVTSSATFPTAPSTLSTSTLGFTGASMFAINLTAA